MPLLIVERTDLLRVVTQVPDEDVPWAVRGRPATVDIDALPGESFHGVISRTAASEDPQSRTMRVEVDLPNPSGRLRPGMYGQVTIDLRTDRNAVVLPVSCLAGPQKDGKAAVYCVRRVKPALFLSNSATTTGSMSKSSMALPWRRRRARFQPALGRRHSRVGCRDERTMNQRKRFAATSPLAGNRQSGPDSHVLAKES